MASRRNITNFNPRTREGCDAGRRCTTATRCIISIHAPVKGATSPAIMKSLDCLCISIHAPVKGATVSTVEVDHRRQISIHAPVKGATRHVRRTRCQARRISIHAPVKGATLIKPFFQNRTGPISIHAPVKGATVCRVSAHKPVVPNFNPRTREGCDPDD